MSAAVLATSADVSPDEGGIGAMAELFTRLREEAQLAGRVILRPHALLVTVAEAAHLVIITSAAVWERGAGVLRPFEARLREGAAAVVVLGRVALEDPVAARRRGLSTALPADATSGELLVAVDGALELLSTRASAEPRRRGVRVGDHELGELLEIARAISTEREVDKLLYLILEKSRAVTGADAGSIYTVEGDDPNILRRTLHFKLSQNDSVTFNAREFSVPVSPASMSGFVALHRRTLNIADVYALPPGSQHGFDPSFDAKTGYRTRSMLCAPLLSRGGDAIGVIQLINKKRDPTRKLRGARDLDEQVVPFDGRSENLLAMLASQAGIVLENALLYAEIRGMLEGFVRASVEAIEQRDPTTSGHSVRVAKLTVALACAVARAGVGPFRDVTWTADDLREIAYASLLHDFGKIGVREEVLLKAKKLFPHELAGIQRRFELAIRACEVDALKRKLELVQRRASAAEITALDEELRARKEDLTAALATICAANEPTILSGGDFRRIEAVAQETFLDVSGECVPLLTPSEVSSLSIARGSLSPAELAEIRSHVSHTYQFLARIPWGRHFRHVASIAGAHHERLNGTGYPRGLHADAIPLQSKMMSISDIFDALTASDRPYKKAIPPERALEILELEVKDRHIDGDLVKIFVDSKVWESLAEADPVPLHF